MSITGTELYSNDMEGKRNDVLYVGAFVFMGIKTFSVKMLFIQTGKYHTKRVGLMGAYTRPEPRTRSLVTRGPWHLWKTTHIEIKISVVKS